MSASKSPIRLGIVGVGKIVRDQHLPALAKNADYQLVATASRNASVDGIANFQTIEEMLAAVPELDAVSLCMPPQYRYRAAHTALEAGKHVFLEKPPGATVSEVEDLKALAAAKGVSLFASWHSRYAPAVEAARAFLASARIKSAAINWKEDVRRWHPEPGMDLAAPAGFGVFDPGINALSIATHILPSRCSSPQPTLDFPGKPRRADRRADRLQRCRRAGGDGRLRLAPDRPAELGHRRRDRCRADGAVGAAAPSSRSTAASCTRSRRPNIRCSTSASPRSCGPASPTSTWRRCATSPTPSCSAAQRRGAVLRLSGSPVCGYVAQPTIAMAKPS